MPLMFDILAYSFVLGSTQAFPIDPISKDASLPSKTTIEAITRPSNPSMPTMLNGPSQLNPAEQAVIQASDTQFCIITIVVLASLVAVLLSYRIAISIIHYIRLVSCVENRNQAFWSQPTQWYAFIKKHLLYAQLLKTHRQSNPLIAEKWLRRTLPTRVQGFFLVLLVTLNVVFCVIGTDWNASGSSLMLTQLRHKSGTIAVVNMLPLVLLSGRNNPLIRLLDIPYTSFSMFHRWLGRMIAVESIVHTSCYIANHVSDSGWRSLMQELVAFGQSAQTGLIGLCAVIIIAAASVPLFRRAFYEMWYHLHVVLVVLFTVTLWYHLDTMPQQNLLRVFILGWITERSVRLFVVIYRSIGVRSTEALVEYLPGDAVKVTLSLARPWNFQPGQHIFLTIPTIGLWTMHPFSLAWSEASSSKVSVIKAVDMEKGISKGKDFVHASVRSISSAHSSSTYLPIIQPTMAVIIRRRTGFTEKLWTRIRSTPGGYFRARAFVEGPYGGTTSLASYGTILLFAGGVGITHQIGYIRALLEGHAASVVSCQRLTLVWAVQSLEHLEWIRPWLSETLAMEGARQILRVQLHITRAYNADSLRSTSTAVQMYLGRPSVDAIVEHEVNSQIGAMAVSVCGPASLSSEVRQAVRERQFLKSIDLIEQEFGW